MIDVDAFLHVQGPLYDVRSPIEFTQGTISGAINLPLFSDEERTAVGTTYKQQCPQDAFLLGLKIAGPKLASFVTEALKREREGPARVFCFRGGQRSGSIAWLFRTAGLETHTLQGGYKRFRTWVQQILKQSLKLVVLGGLTGSGKTAFLHQLQKEGKQIIDLENLANHRGSVFGQLDKQPTYESFENRLALHIASLNTQETIFVEDESRMIGTCKIPDAFFLQMQTAPMQLIETSTEIRVKRLVEEYGQLPEDTLIQAVYSLKKRLGPNRTEEAIAAIIAKDLPKAVILLLHYYDKSYLYSLGKR